MNASDRLAALARQTENELRHNILPYWYQTMDRRQGGFFGHVANDNTVDPSFEKGVVMHSRHLWASSTAWLEQRHPLDLTMAHHAYAFLTQNLYDPQGRGFWWTVDQTGKPTFENKVLYGQAFAVYGLAQYYRATANPQALERALETFELLEGTGRDREWGGYYEAVDRHWTRPLAQALSDVDIACDKSMNTNLHVLEAYSALYTVCGRADVREALQSLLTVMETRVLVTPEHLGLYFDRDWRCLTDHVSYGHDVEASWLMTEAAQILAGSEGQPQHELPEAQKALYARMARQSLAILQAHGGSLANELHNGHLDTDRVWWVQAEALVGLVNGWELTGDDAFLTAAEGLWAWIERYQVDHQHGEWFWLVDAQGRPSNSQPKGGLWKTSYHNGRACLEIMQRATRESLRRPE